MPWLSSPLLSHLSCRHGVVWYQDAEVPAWVRSTAETFIDPFKIAGELVTRKKERRDPSVAILENVTEDEFLELVRRTAAPDAMCDRPCSMGCARASVYGVDVHVHVECARAGGDWARARRHGRCDAFKGWDGCRGPCSGCGDVQQLRRYGTSQRCCHCHCRCCLRSSWCRCWRCWCWCW
jgi:hypothetical protein